MSVLHVLPSPGSKQAKIKFNQYKYCTKAPFVIDADFESILKPSGRQVNKNHLHPGAQSVRRGGPFHFEFL